eukprot:scaffold83912_cov19-Tisochrysis_lutea.AAC.1
MCAHACDCNRCIPKNQPGADWRVLMDIVAADESRKEYKGQVGVQGEDEVEVGFFAQGKRSAVWWGWEQCRGCEILCGCANGLGLKFRIGPFQMNAPYVSALWQGKSNPVVVRHASSLEVHLRARATVSSRGPVHHPGSAHRVTRAQDFGGPPSSPGILTFPDPARPP